jgi:hypothetical protein
MPSIDLIYMLNVLPDSICPIFDYPDRVSEPYDGRNHREL